MRFVPVPKIDNDLSRLPVGERVNVTSAFLTKAKLPASPSTMMRCYYWPPGTKPQIESMSLDQALASAKFADVSFDSRAPEDLRKALPPTAFGFQFVSYGEPSAFNRVAQIVGATPRYKHVLHGDISLVGDITQDIKGQRVLKSVTGSFVIIEPGMQVLRPSDLRLPSAKTRDEVKVVRNETAAINLSSEEIPAFLRRSV